MIIKLKVNPKLSTMKSNICFKVILTLLIFIIGNRMNTYAENLTISWENIYTKNYEVKSAV